MSQFKLVIPLRLRPIAHEVYHHYASGLAMADLAHRYQTSKTAIAAIVHHLGTARPRHRPKAPPRPRAPRKEYVCKPDLKATRVLCAKEHLLKPKLCVLHDYKDSCAYCEAFYRVALGIASGSSWDIELIGVGR